jgi:hypothetical protein
MKFVINYWFLAKSSIMTMVVIAKISWNLRFRDLVVIHYYDLVILGSGFSTIVSKIECNKACVLLYWTTNSLISLSYGDKCALITLSKMFLLNHMYLYWNTFLEYT